MSEIGIGIHAGCGTPAPELLAEQTWIEARTHLAEALMAGWATLLRGGGSVDAVEAAILVLEDSPHFNAGRGAALNTDGVHELEASIMDGATLAAGGVVGVRRVRNPISAARAVMERSSSVLLAGADADRFAEKCGYAMVDNSYFTTDRRRAAQAALQQRATDGSRVDASEADKHGTVGAVALDRAGHLAAGTSTGGFNNKPAGRISDSPIIGAGTYARDGICAISGTGQGEAFIRRAAAYDVTARMMYANATLDQATQALIFDTMAGHAVGAGVVAIDSHGQVLAPFNTLGMYRGWIMADGRIIVATHTEQHVMGQVKTHA